VTCFQLPEATTKLTESRIARSSGAGQATAPPPPIAAIIERVSKHLQGDIQDFRDIALDLEGTASFARRVYEAARQIPTGQTRTYGELAKAIGRPTAARAVGQALGKNPIALLIPCHRVLAAGGKPGGFSAHGGRATKARMLAIEGTTISLLPR
jgi:O-6-methylguanine DNA methyltransferase